MKNRIQPGEIIVIDDVIPIQDQNRIEQLCTSPALEWVYQERSTAPLTNGVKKITIDPITSGDGKFTFVETSQLVHLMYGPLTEKQLAESKSKYKEHVTSIFYPHFITVLSSIPISYSGIKRMKLNMKHSVSSAIGVPDDAVGTPHVDFGMFDPNGVIAIYYVNDSDGDTLIFDQDYRDFRRNGVKGNFTLKQSVSPKKGRMVIFDGNLAHSAGLPRKSEVRIVLNINVAMHDFTQNS